MVYNCIRVHHLKWGWMRNLKMKEEEGMLMSSIKSASLDSIYGRISEWIDLRKQCKHQANMSRRCTLEQKKKKKKEPIQRIPSD